MTKTNYTAPAFGGQYRVELTRTQRAPQWWEYQVIKNGTGALVAGGEVRGTRHLALLAGQREALRLERASRSFYIPPIHNQYHVPC